MTNRRRTLIAGVSGIAISASLLTASYHFGGPVLFWPQVFGYYICILIRGYHTATWTDFALITLPINAALYTVVIYLLLKLLAARASSVAPKL
jgi:hypothetical protein